MSDMPEAILFDAGGTLVLQHPEALEARLGIPVDPDLAFQAHYITMSEFSDLRQSGKEATWDWWLERYFERLGHPRPADAGAAIQRGYGFWTWPIPGVAEAVREMRDAGVRVAVVSNSDGSVEESLGKAGFDGLFEFTLDSALVGSKKPEARIFEIALERLGLDRKSVWYVGDSAFHDIAGAAAAGLGRGVLVDPLGLSSLDAVPSVADLPRLLDTGLALGGGAA